MSSNAERRLLATLAAAQFTSVLDFMLLMPLGAQLMRFLAITPGQFGLLVSLYMVTAAVIGFTAAFTIDRFDRRMTLLVVYAGFALTTILTASAQDYAWLLVARAAAGAFSGVVGATVQAIVGDAIPEGRRGRAFGALASSFSLASIIGIPLGIYLAARWSWRAPFFFLTALGVITFALAFRAVPHVRAHVEAARARSAIAQARAVLTRRDHLQAFGVTVFINFSGFSVVPFIAPYLVANVGIAEAQLAVTYFGGGLAGLVFVRFVGRMTDLHGRRRVFALVASVSVLAIFITTHLPPVALWVATLSQMLLFCAFSGRYVPAMAIVAAAVAPPLRGSFMSFNAALQQLAAGIASFVAAAIVAAGPSGELLHFDTVGWLSIGATVASIALATRLHSARA